MQSLLIFTIQTTFIPTIIGLTLDDLYPFGNQKNDDGSSGEIPISTLFPFFNHQHQKLIVNKVIIYIQIRYVFYLFENLSKAANPITISYVFRCILKSHSYHFLNHIEHIVLEEKRHTF